MKFEGVQELARWINVAQSTSVRRVSRFMEHHWNIPKSFNLQAMQHPHAGPPMVRI